MEFVMYNFSDLEEEDFLDPSASGFHGWYAQSGSWQSSWDANKKKGQRQQQQEQQQRHAEWQQKQQWQAVTELLQQQDAQTLSVVAQVFGKQLEHLGNAEVKLQIVDKPKVVLLTVLFDSCKNCFLGPSRWCDGPLSRCQAGCLQWHLLLVCLTRGACHCRRLCHIGPFVGVSSTCLKHLRC